MATPFFGKRENETPTNLRPGATGGYGSTGSSGTLHSGASPQNSAKPVNETTSPAASSKEGGSKLTVGPNIKLKGVEITDCDTLVVEGLVEATMDSRVIQIAEQGAFKGSAEIDFFGNFAGIVLCHALQAPGIVLREGTFHTNYPIGLSSIVAI